MSHPKGDALVAILPPDDRRGQWWDELFGGHRVPIVRDEAELTILPDGTERLCYFVDFYSCDWLRTRVMQSIKNRPLTKNSVEVLNMLALDIYPVISDNLTICRGPRSLWGRKE